MKHDYTGGGYSVNNIPDSPPILPIWHKNHPLPAPCPFDHRLRMSTRINRTPPINQLLYCFPRIQPYESRSATCCAEYLHIRPHCTQGNTSPYCLAQSCTRGITSSCICAKV